MAEHGPHAKSTSALCGEVKGETPEGQSPSHLMRSATPSLSGDAYSILCAICRLRSSASVRLAARSDLTSAVVLEEYRVDFQGRLECSLWGWPLAVAS